MKSIKQDIRSGIVIFLTIITLGAITVFAANWYDSMTANIGDGLTATKWNLVAKATVPSGAVEAFYLTSCPSGWILADGSGGLTPDLRGTFIRGMNGNINGRDVARVLGNYQDDSFQGHKHLGDYASNTSSTNPYNANLGNLAYYTKDAIQTGYGSDGTNGTPRTSNETRPRNVVLLYCMKQ